MKVRTIENPVIRDKVTFIRTCDETNGEVSEIVVDLAPGGGNEPHYHTSFVESFSPIKGELGVLLGKEKLAVKPGETATVPAGVVHCFFNATDHVVRFRGEARPGRKGLEQFAQIAYGLARDGYVNKKGYPNRLTHVSLLMEMGDVQIPGLTFRALAPIFRLIAAHARRRGVEQELLTRYCT